MKIKPNHGLGALLGLIVLALLAMSASGPDESLGMGPETTDALATLAQADFEAAYVASFEQQIPQRERQASEEAMAGLIGMMMLNQITQAAAQQHAASRTGGYDYADRRGSGSQYSDGSWNHYSGAAGGAVGGTSDGCVYTTFGWSNC